MNKFYTFLLSLFCMLLASCDLQPKISHIPEGIGDFISGRYPALLADPETQPEIYNSAAADYGVYDSADLYGNGNINDYILYASADDYSLDKTGPIDVKIVSNKKEDDYLTIPEYKGGPRVTAKEIIVQKGDTLYSLSRTHNISVKELAEINKLSVPYALSIGQKIKLIKEEEIKTVKPEKKEGYKVTEIAVSKGDTLYSLSRQYQLPVNDLAVINKLSAPFTLSVGQKLKVPYTNFARASKEAESVFSSKSSKTTVDKKTADNSVSQQKQKISSNPAKALPKIASRSSSKFSWPVKGKILSGYGAKSNGLYNDGINISARRGASVTAAENGVVAYAGNELKGMGNLIIVQHSGGWMTVYAHLGSMYVTRGAKVNVGQKIGAIGSTGKVDIPQLHFEIRKGTKSYDPTNRLK